MNTPPTKSQIRRCMIAGGLTFTAMGTFWLLSAAAANTGVLVVNGMNLVMPKLTGRQDWMKIFEKEFNRE